MRKSKSETAATRRRILSAASELFLKEGLAGAGIGDVMAAAGLTQGGFYRHFDSKEQLIAEANRAAFDAAFHKMESAMAGKSPEEALDLVVSNYLRQTAGKTPAPFCPLAALGNEFRYCDPQIQAVAMDGYRRFAGLIAAQLTRLPAAERDGAAGAIVSTLVGAVTLSRLAQNQKLANGILANARKAVETIARPHEVATSVPLP